MGGLSSFDPDERAILCAGGGWYKTAGETDRCPGRPGGYSMGRDAFPDRGEVLSVRGKLVRCRMPTYRKFKKVDFPVDKVRRFLEPGPIVLVSSAHKGERNIMTLGWHMMMDYTTVGCFVWDQNHSHSLIRKSRECVINVPTFDLVDAVIGVGNCHGPEGDKFDKFGLTAVAGTQVDAPLVAECYASFECRLADTRLINKYSLFVFEVVKAHVAASPKYPTTVHYRGDGVFMVAGPSKSYRKQFKPVNL